MTESQHHNDEPDGVTREDVVEGSPDRPTAPKKMTVAGVHAIYYERAQIALALAREEAKRYNHSYIGQEHILLGLLRMEEGVAAKVLSTFGVNVDRVRERVELWIGRGDRSVTSTALELTPRAKRALELAAEESKELEHPGIGTEHILLGILREGTGAGFKILADLDVSLDRARAAIIRFLVSGGDLKDVVRNNVITVRVSDRDLDAIDALLEAGVRSTRSDAASWLISMAIDANPDMFKKVFAAVTDIRRLRGETQAAVQELAPRSETSTMGS